MFPPVNTARPWTPPASYADTDLGCPPAPYRHTGMNLSVSDEIQAESDQLPGSVTPPPPKKGNLVTRTNATYRIRERWASKSGENPLAEAEHLDVTPADVPWCNPNIRSQRQTPEWFSGACGVWWRCELSTYSMCPTYLYTCISQVMSVIVSPHGPPFSIVAVGFLPIK